jgi:ATP-dependent Clp protease ATP-binding subunit ClpB
LDDIIIFHPLTRSEMEAIVDIQITKLEKLVRDKNIDLELTAAAKEYFADKGYDPVYGARSLKRLIQREVQDELAMKFLEGEFGDYDRILIDYRDGKLVFEKNGHVDRGERSREAAN